LEVRKESGWNADVVCKPIYVTIGGMEKVLVKRMRRKSKKKWKPSPILWYHAKFFKSDQEMTVGLLPATDILAVAGVGLDRDLGGIHGFGGASKCADDDDDDAGAGGFPRSDDGDADWEAGRELLASMFPRWSSASSPLMLRRWWLPSETGRRWKVGDGLKCRGCGGDGFEDALGLGWFALSELLLLGMSLDLLDEEGLELGELRRRGYCCSINGGFGGSKGTSMTNIGTPGTGGTGGMAPTARAG
jgi:hypothetical protein